MTSSPFDEKWDVSLTLDWLQALVLGRGMRRRKEEEQPQERQHEGGGEGAPPPPPPKASSRVVDDKKSSNRNQKKIRRVVLQFPDALLPVSLAVQARLKAGSSARGLDLEVREYKNRQGGGEERSQQIRREKKKN